MIKATSILKEFDEISTILMYSSTTKSRISTISTKMANIDQWSIISTQWLPCLYISIEKCWNVSVRTELHHRVRFVVYISGWLVRVQLDNWLVTIEVATRKGNLATQRHCAIRHTRRVDRQSSSHTGGNYDDMGEAQSKNSSWNHSGSASDCILILSPPAHFKTLHF